MHVTLLSCWVCKMNLAVRGIDADIRWNNEGSFHKDELKDLRFAVGSDTTDKPMFAFAGDSAGWSCELLQG